jgi:hypothetical protein
MKLGKYFKVIIENKDIVISFMKLLAAFIKD